MVLLMGGEVLKICIYPFGGISKFKFDLNISILKEFFILIAGPLAQIIAYYILICFFKDDYLTISIYHYGILFFNLLPIYPLDGGKLLNLLFSMFFSYKNSYTITIFIGYILIFIIGVLGIYNFSINYLIIFLFLSYKITTEYRQINYLYERFLLERYLKKPYFKKGIIINNLSKFRRNRRHLIKVGEEYYLEREILEKKYKNY